MSGTRKFAWAGVVGATLVLAAAVLSQEQGVQCESIVIDLRTEMMVMPGMAEMLKNMPELPAGMEMNIPGLTPTRNVGGRAVYIHPPTGKIFVTVPQDLGLPNNILPLELPKPVRVGGPGEAGPTGPPPQMQKFTIKMYWHCTTARGPKVMEFDPSKMPQMPQQMSAEQMRRWEQSAQTRQEGEGKVATGSDSKISPKVVGRGTYVLNTGGQMPLDGFLPPLTVTAPGGEEGPDFTKPIPLQWGKLAGARGFILSAMAMIDPHTMVMWISTENEPEDWSLGWEYEQKTTISDDLAAGILLPGDTTECIIPPNIFTGAGMVNASVVAVGNDFFDKSSAPWLRGRIRSIARLMLGSMEGMEGMGGMFGGEEQ